MELSEIYELYLKHKAVTTDSRDCPEGSIFFALRGDNFDGNAYASKALEQGCAYAVVDEEQYAVKGDPRYILVKNSLDTMQQLAHLHRVTLGLPVIQITGTNGKTTTKELVSAVLEKKYKTLHTEGNLNNHIGVPKTLLRLTGKHQVAVIETGANHPGEIALLSKITDPDFGIITNVGRILKASARSKVWYAQNANSTITCGPRRTQPCSLTAIPTYCNACRKDWKRCLTERSPEKTWR